MQLVDCHHPAYKDAALKLRRIADGNLRCTVIELEEARMEVEAAKAAADAEQQAEREQAAIAALQAYTTSDLDTKATVADVALGLIP